MDLYMFIYQICTAFNLREINKLYPAALDIYPLISFVKLSYFKQLLTNTIENALRKIAIQLKNIFLSVTVVCHSL